MDYVSWCGTVLAQIVELSRARTYGSTQGVSEDDLSRVLGRMPVQMDLFSGRVPVADPLLQALASLKHAGLAKQPQWGPGYTTALPAGRELLRGDTSLWRTICSRSLTPEEEQVLRAINRDSERKESDYAWLELVNYSSGLSGVSIPEGIAAADYIDQIVRDLDARELVIRGDRAAKQYHAQATYAGLVWTTRQLLLKQGGLIDDLVREGETATVDLKRELRVDTASQKAELTKDVIALANTKGPRERHLVIGFRDDGEYYDPADPASKEEHQRTLRDLSEERIQSILQDSTKPVVLIRFTIVDHYLGPVGLLEVRRDPSQLPYAVAKSIGAKERGGHRVEKGQIYLRHGTLTAVASREEIRDLQETAARVKSRETR